jgi:hypothetical protein
MSGGFRWDLGSGASLLPSFRNSLHFGNAPLSIANIPTEAGWRRSTLWHKTRDAKPHPLVTHRCQKTSGSAGDFSIGQSAKQT